MLSSKKSSFSSWGSASERLLGEAETERRTPLPPKKPEPASGGKSKAARVTGERQHHSGPARRTCVLLRRNNVPPSSSTPLYQHISESVDGAHGRQQLALTPKHWKSSRSSPLSYAHKQEIPAHFPASRCLLPRVINHANDLCWACRSYCSHSNASAARKRTGGGVHYRACSLGTRGEPWLENVQRLN